MGTGRPVLNGQLKTCGSIVCKGMKTMEVVYGHSGKQHARAMICYIYNPAADGTLDLSFMVVHGNGDGKKNGVAW